MSDSSSSCGPLTVSSLCEYAPKVPLTVEYAIGGISGLMAHSPSGRIADVGG